MKRVAVTLVLLLVAGGLVYVSLSSERGRAPRPRDAAAPPAEAEPELEAVVLEPRARVQVMPGEGPAVWRAKEAHRARPSIAPGASMAARAWKPWEAVEGQVQAAARTDHDRELVRKIIQSRREEPGITEDD